VFLWFELGAAVFAGLVVVALMIPLNFVLSLKMKQLQQIQMKYKDDRLKMMNEVLSGMKVLKLYAWESSMEKLICDIRAKEVALLKRIAYISAFSTLTWASAPFLVSNQNVQHKLQKNKQSSRWPLPPSPHLCYHHRIIY
jgi:ABC-type multidrug transport system fused ATPase/permease subunit